jgi:hypothetical protein
MPPRLVNNSGSSQAPRIQLIVYATISAGPRTPTDKLNNEIERSMETEGPIEIKEKMSLL